MPFFVIPQVGRAIVRFCALKIDTATETRLREISDQDSYRRRSAGRAGGAAHAAEGRRLPDDAVTSLAGIINALEKKDFDVLMMDLNYTRDTTSGQEGLEVDPQDSGDRQDAADRRDDGVGDVDLAVEAMKRGARDFVPKPWDNERLMTIVRTQIELASALRRGRKLEAENQLLRRNAPNIIAEFGRDAAGAANDFAGGAVGCERPDHGRERDRQRSRRAGAACAFAALGQVHDDGEHGRASPKLFESELFGHVKGAFTDAKMDRAGRFELADESTLFLDEIANVPLNLQAKLLRVLETGEIERVGSSPHHARRMRGSFRRPTPFWRKKSRPDGSGRTCCSG